MNVIGFFLAGLTLLFLGLRISEVITWSYWFVLMPTWVPAIIWFIIEYIEAYQRAKEQEAMDKYIQNHPPKKSKFMNKLEEAIKHSERINRNNSMDRKE